MKTRQLLAMLMNLFVAVAAVGADINAGADLSPHVRDDIDILEALKAAEDLLSRKEEYAVKYANRELEIGMATECFIMRYPDAPDVFHITRDAARPLEYDKELHDRLRDYDGNYYWMVYFTPVDRMSDEAIGFFIGAKASELIHTQLGYLFRDRELWQC